MNPADPRPAYLPDPSQIPALLSMRVGKGVEELVERSLIRPVEEFVTRSGKGIRAKLVEIAAVLSGPPTEDARAPEELAKLCVRTGALIEALHAGALIVDDIQDGSTIRRKAPALHVRYGTPLALNAGNWLYFLPLADLRSLGLPPRSELEFYRHVHEILSRAHCGQAIDLGTPVDQLPQEKVHDVCMASLELKTGALMALALRLGGVLGGADDSRMNALDSLGHRLGIALQIFDDIGNFAAPPDDSLPYLRDKRHEDLYLRRPSFVWAFASRSCPADDYRQFVYAVTRLPDESFLRPWVEVREFVPAMRRAGSEYLSEVMAELEREFSASHPGAVRDLRAICAELEKAYG